jgi:hypothetical protein
MNPTIQTPERDCDECDQPITGAIHRHGWRRLCSACHRATKPASSTLILRCQVVKFERTHPEAPAPAPKPRKPPAPPKISRCAHRIPAALAGGPLGATALAEMIEANPSNIARIARGLIISGQVCHTNGWYHLPGQIPPTTRPPQRDTLRAQVRALLVNGPLTTEAVMAALDLSRAQAYDALFCVAKFKKTAARQGYWSLDA